MRNRWLLNLCLVALVALLAFSVISKRSAEKAEPDTLLTALTVDEINSMRIQIGDNKPVLLEKDKDKWSLAAPLRARVNQFKVRSLLRLATATSELRLPTTTNDLGKYGLDKPKARVWLGSEEIQLGTRHPFKNAQYVLYKDTVHLIGAQDFNPGSYQYTDLISPRLFEEHHKPVALELPDLTLRYSDGRWELRPENGNITPDRINQFVNEWRFARALNVDRYSGKGVRDQIRIIFSDGSTGETAKQETLELGILSYRPDFVLYRKDEGLEYQFTEDTGKRLLNLSPKSSSK